jgi:hypothetical protein
MKELLRQSKAPLGAPSKQNSPIKELNIMVPTA